MINIIIDNTVISLKAGSRNLVIASNEGIKHIPSCIAEISDLKGSATEYKIGDVNNIKSIYPLNRGVLSSDKQVILFSKILQSLNIKSHCKIVVATPETELESGKELLKKAIIDTLSPLDGCFAMYPESFCGAVSLLGVDNAINNFFSVLNLGSTTSGLAVFSAGKKLVLTSYTESSGSLVDEKIFQRVINVYGYPVANLQCIQSLKEQYNLTKNPADNFVPIDILLGTEQKTISASPEFNYELISYATSIANIFISMLQNPPFTKDITKEEGNAFRYNVLSSPLIITGGMSNILGLPELIKKLIDNKTNSEINLQVVKDGHIAPAIGALKLAEELW